MSKWLFPPQDWSKVTKQPLVTRVHGVKGDEPARRIVAHFEALLVHFLQGQTQLRVNSGLDVYGSHQMLDGIKMNYTYQNGMEYLDIYASQEVAKHFETAEDWWDYALVELVLPDGYFDDGATTFNCFAHMTSPVEVILTDASVWPVDGVASNVLTRTTIDPIINAANSAATIVTHTVTDEKAVASFTVDLRQSHGGAAALDLYPYLFVQDEAIPAHTFLMATEPFVVFSAINPADEVPDIEPTFPDPFIAGEEPSPQPDEPTVYFDTASGTWKFSDNNSDTGIITDIGYRYTGDIPPHTGPNTSDTTETFPDQLTSDFMTPSTIIKTHFWHLWQVLTDGTYRPPYTGPKPVPAKLNVTLYKGVPNFTALGFATTHPYDRWGDAAGNLVTPMISIDVMVPAYSNATFPSPSSLLSHFDGIPKLGDVVLDTHRLIRGRPEIIENVTFKQA